VFIHTHREEIYV